MTSVKDPVGTRATCSSCGREIVRIDVLAPMPGKDWQHVDRAYCGGPPKGMAR
jgi:hypothetical protein